MKSAEDVLKFWFEDHGRDDWFGAEPDFDAAVRETFEETFHAVARGEAADWRKTPRGRVAEIIVLDQFSRQLFRGEGRAFVTDGMALILAQEAVASGDDQKLTEDERMFAYLPFMHSESLKVHQDAERLYRAMDNPDLLEYELKHKRLIERFGRYPKRNAALGRESTPQEIAYIEETGDRMF